MIIDILQSRVCVGKHRQEPPQSIYANISLKDKKNTRGNRELIDLKD